MNMLTCSKILISYVYLYTVKHHKIGVQVYNKTEACSCTVRVVPSPRILAV